MSKTKPVRPNFDNGSTPVQKNDIADLVQLYVGFHNEDKHAVSLQLAPPGTSLDKVLGVFKEHTDVPLQIPIAAFFSLLSRHLMKNNASVEVKGANLSPDIWTIVLANSGAGKTYAFNKLESAAKKAIDVSGEFEAVASAAAYVKQLEEKNRTLWFYDEFAQFLAQVENINGSLGQCKEYLLKTYDGKLIQRTTKHEKIEVHNPCLSILGLNTVESFLNKVGEESFTDGFSQRFSYFMAHPDPERKPEQFAWYEDSDISTQLIEAWEQIGQTTLHQNYTVSDAAFRAYEIGYMSLFKKHGLSASFIRRLMYKSWKYALMYHIILGKTSSEIDETDVAWSLRITQQHMIDLAQVLALYNYSKLAKTIEKVDALQLKFSSQGKEFGARQLVQNCRDVRSIPEAKQMLELCRVIKENSPKAANTSHLHLAA